jgi:DNA repair ATPase RecN
MRREFETAEKKIKDNIADYKVHLNNKILDIMDIVRPLPAEVKNAHKKVDEVSDEILTACKMNIKDIVGNMKIDSYRIQEVEKRMKEFSTLDSKMEDLKSYLMANMQMVD